MREFKTSSGYIVDLDNLSTYSNLPQDIHLLRTLILAEIGYAHCYMNYWHPDAFANSKQKERVENFIHYFTENEERNYDQTAWYQEQLFLLRDEIENMC